ncbi:MAG: hypothetical protein WD335_02695 [Candidatus Paceibacterota bacterium]
MSAYFSQFFSAAYYQNVIDLVAEYGPIVMDWFPLWGPVAFGYIFYQSWMSYIRRHHLFNEEHVLLEVTLPKEQAKSPQAMELVLHAFHQTSIPGKFIGKFWEGRVKTWFSLELVSIEGDIHMFIWTPKFFQDIIEYNIYAQYPQVELSEVPDYTDFLQFDTDSFDLWGAEFDLTEDDPYPLKTYIDYEFTGGKDEENQVDPLTPVLEYLGSARRGEQIWIQILIQAHEEKKKKGSLFRKTSWQDEGEELVNELMKRDSDTKLPESANDSLVLPSLNEAEQNTIKAIERNISKLGFDCGIRGLYIAESGSFRPVNIVGLIGSFKQFNAKGRNGFKPARGMTNFVYAWQDYKDKRKNSARNILFDAYRRRSYFYPPYKRPSYVLSAEELATLFHFPGQVSQTPTFKRIESKKSQPPSDLPI